ncbi:hypothetical protein F4810DRAFT_591470 [Camillea tinctor]|nr:hypothetical protein F4810DRAFT_591470 [Camillea tinctor]
MFFLRLSLLFHLYFLELVFLQKTKDLESLMKGVSFFPFRLANYSWADQKYPALSKVGPWLMSWWDGGLGFGTGLDWTRLESRPGRGGGTSVDLLPSNSFSTSQSYTTYTFLLRILPLSQVNYCLRLDQVQVVFFSLSSQVDGCLLPYLALRISCHVS